MQGFPDPYSGLAQGLTQGVQTGANIMQMVYQKAQAGKASEDKELATAMDILKDPNVPVEVKNPFWGTARSILNKRHPGVNLPESFEWDDKLPKQIADLQKKYADNPELLHKAVGAAIATSGDPVKNLAKYDTLLKGVEKEGRKFAWTGTPPTQGLAAPSGYNPNATDTPTTMYGLTGDIPGTPGTPGVGAPFEGLRNTDPMRYEGIKQKWIEGKGLDTGDLPKDEKGTAPQHVIVEDTSSPSGYSYQDFTNPAKPLVKGAPKPGRDLSLTDKDILMPQIKALPKAKQEAQKAVTSIDNFNNLISMLNKGDVGGIEGGFKSVLSPLGELLGFDIGETSEAQAYQLIARAGAAGMRQALIGPGQVTNYEQDLLQKLSGASLKVSREAAKQLFNYYIAQSRQGIENYNQTIRDVSEYDPRIEKAYPIIKINAKGQRPPTGGIKTAEDFFNKKVKK